MTDQPVTPSRDSREALRTALTDGGPCFYCRHDDRQHHTSAVPRWCGECHCKAYAATDENYYDALLKLRTAPRRPPQKEKS